VLPVADIAARLDDRFRLLTQGVRGALPRQQTLRSALDWSWGLLEPAEQELLTRLSAFAASCTLEAAQAVCAGPGMGEWEVLDGLDGLMHKSLLSLEEHPQRARYRLLETVRQYARERLAASGHEAGTRDRHLVWCLGLAERAATGLRSPQQAWWLTLLDSEHDNLRTALAWATQATAEGLQLATRLALFWEAHGHLSEGRHWLESLLATAGEEVPPVVRARACDAAADLARLQGGPGAGARPGHAQPGVGAGGGGGRRGG
jgi:non-specific serine/threonine protein kinase